jgi:hypothetical protein
MNYTQRRTNEFAQYIKSLGFRVYMAKSGTYGFITDDKGERVLSFQFDGLQESLGGNYGPPSRESGTGWRLSASPSKLQTKEDVEKALYSHPDYDCGKGWKHFTTVKQHLADYGSSSQYQEL